jgi:hypothetical protein
MDVDKKHFFNFNFNVFFIQIYFMSIPPALAKFPIVFHISYIDNFYLNNIVFLGEKKSQE